MNTGRHGLLLLLFIFLNASSKTGAYQILNTDSTNYRKFSFYGFLSTSLFINRNWKEEDNSAFLFSGNIDLVFRKRNENTSRIHELRSELCYMKFIDSTWNKTVDNTSLSSIWILFGRNGFRNSFSVNIKSQITDTWEYDDININQRVWKSGPLLPASVVVGYGINWSFWKNSYINVSFAAIKINCQSNKVDLPEDKKIFARTDKALLFSEYGCNIQSSVEKSITKKISWINKSSFFSTGLDKRVLTFDVQNIIAIKPFRFFQIRLDNKLSYDFLESEKIQIRQELLIGVSLEKK